MDIIANWSVWAEIIATITGVLCVYLQTKEKVSAWFFGIISVSLLAMIFLDAHLVSDFILHIIFLILNIYGWWTWRNYRNEQHNENKALILSKNGWVIVVSTILLVTPLWGYTMLRYFNADFAYFDAFTTVGSLVAQYLLAKKYIENWLVWIIVDIVAIGVYTFKGLFFVTFLFMVYLVLCTKGYLDWKKRDRNNYSHPINHLIDKQ